MELNYGLVIDPLHIRMIEDDKTFAQINNQHQLFINGREIKLTEHQNQLMAQYSSSLREQIPQLIDIAMEGVDVGLAAVNTIVTNITGENSQTQQDINTRFEELKWSIQKRFNQSDGNHFIAPQKFDDFEQLFAQQFEQEIENIFTESLGSIVVAIGEAITNHSEKKSSLDKELSMEQRIEFIHEQLHQTLRPKVESLKAEANKFCKQLMELNKIEQELSDSIPALSSFDLIKAN